MAPFLINKTIMYNKFYNYNLTAYSKIKKCIESCETIDQYNSCARMIYNFSYICDNNIDKLGYNINWFKIKTYHQYNKYISLTEIILEELKKLCEDWVAQYQQYIEEENEKEQEKEIPKWKYKDFKVKGFTTKNKRRNGKKKMDNPTNN